MFCIYTRIKNSRPDHYQWLPTRLISSYLARIIKAILWIFADFNPDKTGRKNLLLNRSIFHSVAAIAPGLAAALGSQLEPATH